ncbi:integral membrane protein PTH11-like protein [Aspergillus heteromorphus CBS 117.55]|uniref:Integral membrane protein PTH11-like protein n=1 Tax=Aspergillus heteromorphus CBS 117.55 TaxID=1448321 RepID=A0A317W531_9EURO|nr:integral membrane protein PTH11-like protein [Aspergillus heteromorphus CBS 117.55]PWY79240.1 integral membrane protein PTH11-like protein [Aspergillus heteromorphus CBS 117.55]
MSSSDETATRVPVVIAGYAVPIAGMVLTTGLRLFVKFTGPTEDRFHADDYLITLATVRCPLYPFGDKTMLEVAYCIVMLVVGVGHGFGKHAGTLSIHDLEIFLKGDYIASHLYNVGLASVKLGILALYYRIFTVPWFRKIVMGCAVFVCLWIATIEIFMGLLCRPLRSFWNVSIKGKCFNSTALTYYINTSNMITDIIIFTLPIGVILRLRTSKQNKIALCVIFSIGFVTCGISAARLAFVFAQSSSDITWDGVDLAVLSGFESFGGILCANLPIIYRLFKQAAQKVSSGGSSAPKTTRVQYGRESTNYGSRSRPRRTRLSDTLNEEWIQLQNGNSSNESHYPDVDSTSELALHKGVDMETGTELVRISTSTPPSNAITVQREFHQTVETHHV